MPCRYIPVHVNFCGPEIALRCANAKARCTNFLPLFKVKAYAAFRLDTRGQAVQPICLGVHQSDYPSRSVRHATNGSYVVLHHWQHLRPLFYCARCLPHCTKRDAPGETPEPAKHWSKVQRALHVSDAGSQAHFSHRNVHPSDLITPGRTLGWDTCPNVLLLLGLVLKPRPCLHS